MSIFVKNKYKDTPSKEDIFIGRGSPLGNPYTHISDRFTKASFVVSSREESIQMYESFLRKKIQEKDKPIVDELNRIYLLAKKGDVSLVCYCKPKACHGDIIKQIIEEKL